MTWFKVDDSFHSHPKVYACDADALGLWVVAGSWCSANLTDGRVPDASLLRLMPNADKLAAKLVECGLWVRVKAGYQFHGWTDYNPTADDVKAEREAARERMRNLRRSRMANQKTAGQAQDCSDELPENFGGSSEDVRDPDPTRPELPLEVPVGGRSEPRPAKATGRRRDVDAKVATRISEDFHATPEMIDWARKNTPNVGTKETEAFVDYWVADATPKSKKLDWVRAWKVWMRREQKRVEEQLRRSAAWSSNGNGHLASRPPSDAPKHIPDDEMCPEHPGKRKDNCGLCRADRLAKSGSPR